MTNRKYQRKRERAKQRAQQKLVEAQGASAEGIETEHKENATDPSNTDSNKTKGRSMSAIEVSKPRSTFSEKAITAFTLALAVLGYFQYQTMSSQLNVMRNDERAWIELDFPSRENQVLVKSGQALSMPFRIANIGKTPATNVSGTLFVDLMEANQPPPLSRIDSDSGYAHGSFVTGIIFPAKDIQQTAFRMTDTGAPKLITQAEEDEMRSGKTYMVMYGILRYTDVFGVKHWTRYCKWQTMMNTDYSVRTEECTKYNNVGDE